MTSTPAITHSQATLMIKPVGAKCNLQCRYCYYLPTAEQWRDGQRRMSLETLEAVLSGALPAWGDQVTIAWQGGEPTLAGLEFFEQALAIQNRYARPGQRVDHALQTNGTLLDDAWCRFFKRNNFLVGLSLDGPARLHDHYRVDSHDDPTSTDVLNAMELLRRHRVEFNVLCVLNDRNVKQPEELLGFFVNRGLNWLQFIPAIEWETDVATDEPRLATFSPTGEAYGTFLCRVFDRWFERYRDRVSIRLFDAALLKLVHGEMPLCILSDSCHTQLTVEHDGTLFGCDHFVEPRWRLGRITDSDWPTRIATDRIEAFAERKQHLPESCEACPWLRFCYGGCPKHRPHRGDVAAATVLCDGYRMFYDHAIGRLEWLADYFRRGQQPPPPGQAPGASTHAASSASPMAVPTGPGAKAPSRNAPCHCGSGLKFKRCHGRRH